MTLDATAARCHLRAMWVYKILRSDEWADLVAQGETDGAPVDIADGFVHLSTAAQVDGTLARHFAGEGRLVLLALKSEALGGALKWEASRGGDLFPHLYAKLRMAHVSWSAPVLLSDSGTHILPEGVK